MFKGDGIIVYILRNLVVVLNLIWKFDYLNNASSDENLKYLEKLRCFTQT